MARVKFGAARNIDSNWSSNVQFSPSSVVHPRSEGEIVHHLAHATARQGAVKPIGAGHSFSAIAQPADVTLTLDNYRGLVSLDRATGEVTLRAGTRLYEIGPLLRVHGRALATMGDIDKQSIAGAISTGTHGTGAKYTGFAALVTGVKLVLANGDVLWADAEQNPVLFEAARLSLGALGVIVEVRMKTVPLYKLHKNEYTKPLDKAVSEFLQTNLEHDHQEFFWSPSAAKVSMRDLDHVPFSSATKTPIRPLEAFQSEVLGNGVFHLVNEVARRAPKLSPTLAASVMTFMPSSTTVDLPYKVFSESRRIRFRETELAIAANRFEEAFEVLQKRIADSGTHIVFPLEVRRGQADQVWLSSSYERDTVYIAAHIPVAETNDEYLRLVHDTLAEFDGRPHWGKMHWMSATELGSLYPNFENFRAVREEVDPARLFANPYLETVLGE